jgi:hypothetical protein
MGILLTCGACNVSKKVKQDKASLRVIATALAAYGIDWQDSPLGMESLTRYTRYDNPQPFSGRVAFGPYLERVPHSAFVKDSPVQLLIVPRTDALGAYSYLAWTEGPDKTFDLKPDDKLKQEFKATISAEKPSPWITERIYDPTNGTRSKGDIIRLHGNPKHGTYFEIH